MEHGNNVRIDKFLYAVRLYKTRSLASDACRLGRVLVDNTSIKPSKEVIVGQKLTVKKAPVTYTYQITGLINNRVSAKLTTKYITDLTPESEMEKLLNMKDSGLSLFREKGTGRPTKKERRNIDRLTNNFSG